MFEKKNVITPEQWIVEGEVGTSSKTIWVVMQGVVRGKRICDFTYDTPKDPSDFERCHNLLSLFPEWRKRLNEVSTVFPKWIPFVREWSSLENMYYKWKVNVEKYHTLSAKERKKFVFADGMFECMQKLEDEGLLLDGWKETGVGSWKREKINE